MSGLASFWTGFVVSCFMGGGGEVIFNALNRFVDKVFVGFLSRNTQPAVRARVV